MTIIDLKLLDEGTKIRFASFKDNKKPRDGYVVINNIGEKCFCPSEHYDDGNFCESNIEKMKNVCRHFEILQKPKHKSNYSFVVSALRWGNDEDHSYVVGIFDDEKIAIECANKHKIYRGGKYECIVEKFKTNHYDEETAIENNEIIYKTN